LRSSAYDTFLYGSFHQHFEHSNNLTVIARAAIRPLAYPDNPWS